MQSLALSVHQPTCPLAAERSAGSKGTGTGVAWEWRMVGEGSSSAAITPPSPPEQLQVLPEYLGQTQGARLGKRAFTSSHRGISGNTSITLPKHLQNHGTSFGNHRSRIFITLQLLQKNSSFLTFVILIDSWHFL